jgi:catechol 2,3-dioxygenase-like lactoylglutathione lyase family enzyme
MGMKLIGRWKIRETGGEIAALKSPDTPVALELNWYPEASRFFEPQTRGTELDHLNFDCDDVDQEIERLRGEGVKVVIEPFDEGDSRLAYVEDPDGITVQLQSPRSGVVGTDQRAT